MSELGQAELLHIFDATLSAKDVKKISDMFAEIHALKSERDTLALQVEGHMKAWKKIMVFEGYEDDPYAGEANCLKQCVEIARQMITTIRTQGGDQNSNRVEGDNSIGL